MGRGELKAPARVGLQPVLYFLGAAGGEVVADRDDSLVFDDRYLRVEVIEEADLIEAVAGL